MILPSSLVSQWKNQCFYLKDEPEDSLYRFACLAAAWGVKQERELWIDAVNKRKAKQA